MIDIKVEAERLAEKMAFSKQQTAKVVAVTLSDAAYKIRSVLQTEMKARFDRPTPFVLNSIYVKKAIAKGTTIEPAEVGIKGKSQSVAVTPAHVLHAQVAGGKRKQKRSEILLSKLMPPSMTQMVPGAGAPRDAHGNVPGAYLQKVFSALQAQFDATSNSVLPGSTGLRKRDLLNAAKVERKTGGAQVGRNGRLKQGLRGYGTEAQAYLIGRQSRKDKKGNQMGSNFFVGRSKANKGGSEQRIVYEFDWVQKPGKRRPNNPNPEPVLVKGNIRPVLIFTRGQTYRVQLPMQQIAQGVMDSPATQKLLEDTASRLFTKWNTR